MTKQQASDMTEFVAKSKTSDLIHIAVMSDTGLEVEIRAMGGADILTPGIAAAIRLLVKQEIDRRIPVPS